ncbi:hypothetical protein KPH14_012593 [Odynerus spinipes]|uniref:CCHC-type domain-containing protein n=1 Tax=Odynerus spinipes TaxID=1348599 RepID=A0AAD9RE95_9HYME|nr:hypothetical protein KPH14_012593 [Odynerus spinipes]
MLPNTIYYEKLARCNRAGPLSRYPSPSTLLPDLRSAVHFLQERAPINKGGRDKDRPERGTRPKICFNCKAEEHDASRCNKPKSNICFRCDKPGHYAKDCRSKAIDGAPKRSSSANDVGQVLRIETNQNQSKYFKEARINGNYLKCYVDLGSLCIALRKDAADEMNFTYLEGTFDQLVGYGAGSVTPIGMLTATIAIDGVEARARIYVVPSECQAIPLIIGHSYTEQRHVEIISRPNELVIRRIDDQLLDVVPEENQKTKLWAEKAVVIPNNYVGYVAVHTGLHEQDICLEGGMREDGQLIPRCLLKTDSRGMSVVPVLNVTRGELNIDEGVTIARGEAITLDSGNPKCNTNTEPVKLEEINVGLPRERAEEIASILNNFKELIARNIRQIDCTDKANKGSPQVTTCGYERGVTEG